MTPKQQELYKFMLFLYNRGVIETSTEVIDYEKIVCDYTNPKQDLCQCGNPSKEGIVKIVNEENLLYFCCDCGKQKEFTAFDTEDIEDYIIPKQRPNNTK